MYAHQVIEDLEMVRPLKGPNHYFKNVRECIPAIRRAEKFHFGSEVKFYDLFAGHYRNEVVFNHGGAKYLKLPFRMSWFDFHDEFMKVGFLVNEVCEKDDTIFQVMQFVKSDPLWLKVPFLFFCSVGKGLIENQLAKDIIMGIHNDRDFLNCKTEEMDSTVYSLPDVPGKAVESFEKLMELNGHFFWTLDWAIQLLNCRNIELSPNYPPVKLNKARKKKNKEPLLKYYTLDIVKPTIKSTSGKVSQGTIDRKRFHFCRGHFKEYTKDKPLFGKYTGLYWWEPHVRGDKKKGVVIKDYNVKTKKAA
jgi:hypothetical protein